MTGINHIYTHVLGANVGNNVSLFWPCTKDFTITHPTVQ